MTVNFNNPLVVFILCISLVGCLKKELVPLKISSDVEGAQVYIDGDFKGNTPLNTSVLEGSVTVKVVAHKFDKEESVNLIKKEKPEVINVNFNDELIIVGKRAFWDETTKYKVPVDAGGGLLGFFVSKATNGGLTESFLSTWRGSIVDEDNGYSNIELDNVEVGYGKYSYKGKSYRIDKEEEILAMIGSTVTKDINDIHIEPLHDLKNLLKSANHLNLKGSGLLQASSLLKLYSNKFLSKKSKSYQDNIKVAEDYAQITHNSVDATSIDSHKDRQKFLTIVTRELFKASETVIPFIDWERYELLDDVVYDKDMTHKIKGRYEIGLIAQHAHLNGYKKALGKFLEHTKLDQAKLSASSNLSLVAPSTKGNVTMQFTMINNIPKLQSVKM